MPDIGASLREERMRSRIDITEIEAQTKIRVKYLRALENEEWDLLPGPTYVKSFLRTYAEALGLDGRLLVEEYKLRHERLSDVELQPISPRSTRERQRRRPPGAGRDIAVAVVVIAIVGGLIALGRLNGGDGNERTTPPPATQTAERSPSPAKQAKPKPARPRTVTLTLVTTGSVYICLRAGARVLVGAQTIPPGRTLGPYRARRFAMTFGNNSLRMRVNGRLRTIAPSSGAIGYVLDRNGRRLLQPGRLPTCGG